MHERFRELHAACLPFVTRALRGPARRRFVLGSTLIVLVVLVLGTWIGRSPSFAAHDVRVSLGLETSRWQLEQREFTIFVADERERQAMRRPGADGVPSVERYSPLRHRAEEAWVLLEVAAGPHVVPPRTEQELHARAKALRDSRADLAPLDLESRRAYQRFNWWSPQDRQRLQAIVDSELLPRVEIYTSPLDAAGTIRLVGALAGGLLLAILTVLAPLLVGVQLAQELHENTLQPLTGTALTSRQLVLGLVAGPLAPVALVAAPQLGLVLLAAVTAGRMVPALGMLVMGAAMGAMLVGLAMLVALSVGRKRAPGIVGIGLLAMLGVAGLAGLAAGVQLEAQTLGLVTVLPGAGPLHLLTEAFLPRAYLSGGNAMSLDLRLGLATVGAAVLAALAVRALERVVGGTHQHGALRPVEAAVGAAMLAALAVAAIPLQASAGEAMLASLAIALVPVQLLLMSRLPGGDVPPGLRHVPVGRLLREHSLWLSFVLVLGILVEGPPHRVQSEALIGLMHLGWALFVTALVTLRGAARPNGLLGKLWLMFCLGAVMIEYGTGAMWCMSSPKANMVFPLVEAHPFLGLLQISMVVWIPISLLRGLVPFEPPMASTMAPRED